jgi:hypothetical protein
MIRLVPIIAFSCIIISCSDKDHDKGKDGYAMKSKNITKHVLPGIRNAKDTSLYKKLEFNPQALPSSIKFDGKLLGGAKWFDRNGENILIVSSDTKWIANEAGESSRQILNAYLYTECEKTPTLLWKSQDQYSNPCEPGAGLISSVEVEDIDGDNIAENAFVYSIWGACEPAPTKYSLLFHSGANKYIVSGTNIFATNAGKTKIGGDINIDPGLSKRSQEFKKFALKIWKKSVKDKIIE